MSKLIPFLSAGHHIKDSGAVAIHKIHERQITFLENKLTMEVRNGVVASYNKLYGNLTVITDKDEETLSQYLNRIKTGNGSVVCEFHFDSSANSQATGTTAIIGNDATKNDKDFATEL